MAINTLLLHPIDGDGSACRGIMLHRFALVAVRPALIMMEGGLPLPIRRVGMGYTSCHKGVSVFPAKEMALHSRAFAITRRGRLCIRAYDWSEALSTS
jgi:hypothetical protein